MHGLTELMLVLAAVVGGVPLLFAGEWATTRVEILDQPPSAASGTWMTGPGARDAFAAGGVRALIDRSPMRYDAAIYLGGAP